jgi:DNA-binding NarL/FixJ family response regulator
MEGLRSLMESIDGPRVVAAETSVEDGADAIRDLQPSLVILDKSFGMPTVTDWVRLLSSTQNPASVIVWGTTMSENDALRLLQAGASGVVRKTAALAEIAGCIRAVAAGGTWMESEMAPDARPARRNGRSALTPREIQVLNLVERGYRNKDIGQSLGIGTGTVKIHLKHIFEKTGIRGRYGLALYALKHKGLPAVVTPKQACTELQRVIMKN